MFQVGTANNNNNQVHPNIVMPSILATLHPNNSNHPNPKIISRSPSALLTQDQRSL